MFGITSRNAYLSASPREIAISACNFPASKLGKHFSFAGYLFATSQDEKLRNIRKSSPKPEKLRP